VERIRRPWGWNAPCGAARSLENISTTVSTNARGGGARALYERTRGQRFAEVSAIKLGRERMSLPGGLPLAHGALEARPAAPNRLPAYAELQRQSGVG